MAAFWNKNILKTEEPKIKTLDGIPNIKNPRFFIGRHLFNGIIVARLD